MAKKKITVKGIVAAIEEVLKDLDEADKGKKVSIDRQRTKKQLRGICETVEGMCVPSFALPEPDDP